MVPRERLTAKVPPIKLPESGDSRATVEVQKNQDPAGTVRFTQPKNHVMTTPPKHQFSSASEDADGPEIVVRSRAPKSSHKKGAVRTLFKEDAG